MMRSTREREMIAEDKKFKVEVFVRDKHLGDVLRSLAGKIDGMPSVVPVVNAAVGSNGKHEPMIKGQLPEIFAKWVADQMLTTIVAADFRRFQEHVGRSPKGYSHFAQQMVDAGIVKKKGKGTGMTYVVARRK